MKSNINKIEKGTYDGYLWYSDQHEPLILDQQEFECHLDNDVNPYILEGQLYDQSAKVSYSIKYIDGHYIAIRYDGIDKDVLSFDKNIEVENQFFCANRMEDRLLIFQQWWREQPDPLCECMQVLQPAEMIFVGFKKEGGR